MKRYGNIYNEICSIENLKLADLKARKGKSTQHGVQAHDKKREENIKKLHEMLMNKGYKTSKYSTFIIHEPKEREIFVLPYFPDRILHHAIMNKMEEVFVSTFTADTYSCIKGRGIHGAFRAVRRALDDRGGTQFCLKLDLKKFYPSIDHEILKALLRRKVKDRDLLELLDEIIDSAAGLPIGNYLSQYLANFYLTYFDYWIKQVKGVKHYFRYADDLVILSGSKGELHELLEDIKIYLKNELKLEVKENYQVFPVTSRGLDFVGYKFFHTHTLLRKSIKKNFARMVKRGRNAASIASYNGWAGHGNCRNLIKKLLHENSKII